MDGFEGKTDRVKLDYPFDGTPEPGTTIEVAPGVRWLRMPLPFSLQWINLWLLEDGEGWTIVDTGIGDETTREHWRTIFDNDLDGKPVTRVMVTHMHPDHVGLAGWLTRKWSCELWMSRLEYISCRMLVNDTGREAPEDGLEFYRAAGWDEPAIENYKSRFGGFGKAVSRMPDSYRRLEDGDEIDIGGRIWRVIEGNGHSPGHSCLYCSELNVLIAGDQLLPRISSNVSVFPTEPEADPLADWLNSCEKLKNEVDADALILPAHNEPFYGGHLRLQALIDGHEKMLDRVLSRMDTPKRPVDLFTTLFARKIDLDVLSMATGETIAHLNCLIRRGLARREMVDGVNRYSRVS